MKTRLLLLVAVLALVALVGMNASVARADTEAHCWTDSAEYPLGPTIWIYCEGFTPNTRVTSYFVEPDGAAATFRDDSLKIDEHGSLAVPFYTDFGTYDGRPALGTYTIVFDEKGLANTILRHAEVKFRLTGGTEGVSGAKIWFEKDNVRKGETYVLYGLGFQPGEVVSVWYEYPNGDCSLRTYHDGDYNTNSNEGLSVNSGYDVTAAQDGSIIAYGAKYYTECEGVYRYVARGNSSYWGGETWLTVTGDPVSTNAWLTASPDRAAALFDWVYFSGSGFGANESISCWLRSPQGSVTVVDQLWQKPVKSDAGGNVYFSIYTGSYFPPYPNTSEGALGVYAMTCRGNVTQATAIAEFTVTGGMFDP